MDQDADPALQLLAALCADEGAPLARLRKHSGLPMSSLLRSLGELEALGLVERRAARGRECLFLTEQGRSLCPSA